MTPRSPPDGRLCLQDVGPALKKRRILPWEDFFKETKCEDWAADSSTDPAESSDREALEGVRSVRCEGALIDRESRLRKALEKVMGSLGDAAAAGDKHRARELANLRRELFMVQVTMGWALHTGFGRDIERLFVWSAAE